MYGIDMTKVADLLKQLADPEMRQKLADEGIVVTRKLATIKKTYEVDEATAEEMARIAKASKMKLKDAMHEAMSDWIGKRKKKG